jgi:hypothetical protein
MEDLQGMEIFSKFDVRWGYNNIRIRPEDQWKGAFKMRRGLMEPKVMFFGMSNSPGTFQCFMNHILEPWYIKYGRKKGKNYMDDIGIATLSSERDLHIAMIHDLFDILTEHGLHLKLSKSTFMQPQMNFLGVQISKDRVTVNPAKIAGLKGWPRHLKNLREARGFLGVAGYHCMFVPGFSKLAAPITKLTSKGVPFVWGPEQQEAQNKIIDLITNAPILAWPDPSRQFELEVDASQISTGAILYQRDPPTTIKGKEKAGAR